MEKDFLLLIDGSSLLTTQYYGNMPDSIKYAKTEEEKKLHYNELLQTSTGIYTNAVYGFLKVLIKIIKEQQPKYLAVAWDISRDTFRKKINEDYKSNRTETPNPLKEQFKTCQDILHNMGIKQFFCTDYEADDFCGSLVNKFEKEIDIKILTKDHDYFQLASDKTHIWLLCATKKIVKTLCDKYSIKNINLPDKVFELNPELIFKEYGFTPEVLPMVKALAGDTCDNIKGIPGIGEKTALILANEFKTIDNLYNKIKGLSDSELKELQQDWKKRLGLNRSPIHYLLAESEIDENGNKILKGEEAGRQSELLATIKKDIDLSDINLNDLKLSLDTNIVNNELTKYEIHSIKY